MGLFFRDKTLPEEEQVRQARVLIQETNQILTCSPEKALKILRKKSKPLYKALTFHGRAHDEFKEMMFRRSFLLEGSQALDPDWEDIGQDFLDYAEKTGKKVVNIW